MKEITKVRHRIRANHPQQIQSQSPNPDQEPPQATSWKMNSAHPQTENETEMQKIIIEHVNG